MRALLLVALWLCSCVAHKQVQQIDGLKQSVEILRDQWGINHIYAKNQRDLFFSQGYAAAKDRLFQFEIWRRQATGTVAEILGERELKRDIGARLFAFRGDLQKEMNHYHEDGVEIITAYTQGVNAYISEALAHPDQLPIEFKLLDILPQKWTPEVVVSRHQGLLGNIGEELTIGRAVSRLGIEQVKELYWFHPKDPDINLDPSIDQAMLSQDILALYNAFRNPVKFLPTDVQSEYRNTKAVGMLESIPEIKDDEYSLGSNNWVVSGALMEDGNTYMANDPHRTIAVPSLRYMTHLVAPGWDVIGGGEPEIPGISIGHNTFGAWGLTVFRTDGEDMYVYDLNPKDIDQYRYKGAWTDMRKIRETIAVKGQENRESVLRYTRHGPVVYVDSARLKAYTIRCAWLEIGGSPYLASLRMDQAESWDSFREACNYSHIPGENMVWADIDGTIGWQAVGIAPIRKNFSGLVPVPGDGRYEWNGYLPIIEKPNLVNPTSGYIATANQHVTPDDYTHWDAIGYSWSDPYRGDRIREVLESGKKLTMDDMQGLQVDYLSLPASILVPLVGELQLSGKAAEARSELSDWDLTLKTQSIAAAIYASWENEIRHLAAVRFIPDAVKDIITSIQLKRIIDWIIEPNHKFGRDHETGRNRFLQVAFESAVARLEDKLGEDIDDWQYGQSDFKHVYMAHALSYAVQDDIRSQLDLGPLPRGGNGYTTNSTSNRDRQSSGASFRIIVNTGDWDTAVATNSPGQSGSPTSPYHQNLFQSWAKDQYFPIYFSRKKIESVTVSKSVLQPRR